MGKDYSLRITNDNQRLPILLANFVKPILSNPTIKREEFEQTYWQAYHVETELGNISIQPEWGYTSYEYPYGMMITSEIILNGNPSRVLVDRWYHLLVRFLSSYQTDFILCDVDAVRKSNTLYIDPILYEDYFDAVFSSISDLKMRPIDELIDWDAGHYIDQTHQLIISDTNFTANQLLQHFLSPLHMTVEPEKSITSTMDFSVVVTSASHFTLDEFHHINSSFPIEPAFIIEITPSTWLGYRHLLTCLNHMLALDCDVLFAWQGITWVIKKYGTIYMNSEHKAWFKHYADLLKFDWKSASLLGHAPTAY